MAVKGGLYNISGASIASGSLSTRADFRSSASAITTTASVTGQVTKVDYSFGSQSLTDYAFFRNLTDKAPTLIVRDTTTINGGIPDTMLDNFNKPLEQQAQSISQLLDVNGRPTLVTYYLGAGVTQTVINNYSGVSDIPNTIVKQPRVVAPFVISANYSTLLPARGQNVVITYSIPPGSPSTTLTPITNTGGGVFSPANITTTSGQLSATFTYTPNTSETLAILLGSTNALVGVPLPAVVKVDAAPLRATGYTVTSTPEEWQPNETITFTITATPGSNEGFPAGTVITPNILSGSGVINPASLSLAVGSTGTTFTFTPTTGGSSGITFVNNRNLSNPADVVKSVGRLMTWTTTGNTSYSATTKLLSLAPNRDGYAMSQAITWVDGTEMTLDVSNTPFNFSLNQPAMAIFTTNPTMSIDDLSPFPSDGYYWRIVLDWRYMMSLQDGVRDGNGILVNRNLGIAPSAASSNACTVKRVGRDLQYFIKRDGVTTLVFTSLNKFPVGGLSLYTGLRKWNDINGDAGNALALSPYYVKVTSK